MADFKTIDVPTGRFISWGKLNQTVTVRVVSFDPTGGRDFQNNICPQLIGTLVEDCDNYRDKGATHERLSSGEMVTVNGGVANLRKGLLLADPKPGDLVRMTYIDTYKTAQGDGKVIKVEHAHGSDQPVTADDL